MRTIQKKKINFLPLLFVYRYNDETTGRRGKNDFTNYLLIRKFVRYVWKQDEGLVVYQKGKVGECSLAVTEENKRNQKRLFYGDENEGRGL